MHSECVHLKLEAARIVWSREDAAAAQWFGREPRMMTVFRAAERSAQAIPDGASWRSLALPPRAVPVNGDDLLEATLEEISLEPRGRVPFAASAFAECITYVCEGALEAEQTLRTQTHPLLAGEFHRSGPYGDDTMLSHDHAGGRGARLFRLSLPAAEGATDGPAAHRRFSLADRQGRLRLVASGNGGHGSLRLQQDTRVYAAALGRGTHLAHVMGPGRSAWLHIVDGCVAVNDIELVAGDAASTTGPRALSLLARSRTEVLLIDRGYPARVAGPRPAP